MCSTSGAASGAARSFLYSSETLIMTTTTKPAANADRNDLNQANAQLKEAILNKKRVQIEVWSAQIEQLQEGMSGLAESVRSSTRQHLDDLTNARNQATAQLEQLQQSTQENWEALLQQSDAFFQDLADRFHRFASKND
jgi:DNA anti-recombination protein RmuC